MLRYIAHFRRVSVTSLNTSGEHIFDQFSKQATYNQQNDPFRITFTSVDGNEFFASIAKFGSAEFYLVLQWNGSRPIR